MTAPRARSSGQLGVALRSVLLNPRAGFADIFRAIGRRAQTHTRAPEGVAPYLLAALGGVAGMLFWLKVGALLGFRQVAAIQFRWSYIVVAVIAGAVVALVAQMLWGFAGAIAARLAGSDPPPRELRVVWGASSFPQIAVLLLLLPLDLLIVGPATFTSERLTDPLSTGWAALSIALSASVAVWSIFIFLRGVEVAVGVSWARAVPLGLLAALCLVLVTTGSVVALRALAV